MRGSGPERHRSGPPSAGFDSAAGRALIISSVLSRRPVDVPLPGVRREPERSRNPWPTATTSPAPRRRLVDPITRRDWLRAGAAGLGAAALSPVVAAPARPAAGEYAFHHDHVALLLGGAAAFTVYYWLVP